MKKNRDMSIRSSAAEYLTYIAATGESSIEVIYQDENIWLSQKMLAALYDVTIPTINEHLQTIFNDSELEKNSVIRNFRITANDSKQYNTMHYSLECIIAVGNKVNSERAIQFRKWSNKIIKDFTIQGWVMDKERLKRVVQYLQMIILKNSFKSSEKLERVNVDFIKK